MDLQYVIGPYSLMLENTEEVFNNIEEQIVCEKILQTNQGEGNKKCFAIMSAYKKHISVCSSQLKHPWSFSE